MKTRRTFAAAVLALATGCSPAPSPTHAPAASGPDPTVTDPDNYKVVLENDAIRVLRYHDVPGTKTHPHHHPPSVLVALSSFKRRLSFPDRRNEDLELASGTVMWLPAQDHQGENTGSTDTDVVLVEVKHAP